MMENVNLSIRSLKSYQILRDVLANLLIKISFLFFFFFICKNISLMLAQRMPTISTSLGYRMHPKKAVEEGATSEN